jgi:phosphomannomutase
MYIYIHKQIYIHIYIYSNIHAYTNAHTYTHTNAHIQVVLAFEESIGFCCGDIVNDKDGVSAAAVFAEMAGQLAARGK